jgi:uncharacterized Fe-S center protein
VALDAATFDLLRESHSFAKTGVDSMREIGEVDFAEVLKDAETMGVGCAERALRRLS